MIRAVWPLMLALMLVFAFGCSSSDNGVPAPPDPDPDPDPALVDPQIVGAWFAEDIPLMLVLNADGTSIASEDDYWDRADIAAADGIMEVEITGSSDPDAVGRQFGAAYSIVNGNLRLEIEQSETQVIVLERLLEGGQVEEGLANIWTDGEDEIITISPTGHMFLSDTAQDPAQWWCATIDAADGQININVLAARDAAMVGEQIHATYSLVNGTLNITPIEHAVFTAALPGDFAGDVPPTVDPVTVGAWFNGDVPVMIVINADGTMSISSDDNWDAGTVTTAAGDLQYEVKYSGDPADVGDVAQLPYTVVGDELRLEIDDNGRPWTLVLERLAAGGQVDAAITNIWLKAPHEMLTISPTGHLFVGDTGPDPNLWFCGPADAAAGQLEFTVVAAAHADMVGTQRTAVYTVTDDTLEVWAPAPESIVLTPAG